jgi:NADP-dependent 3-hydroxy acid dehydrogenase YdfG
LAFSLDIDRFRFSPALAEGVKGKRVLISGAGRDGGMGQGFALAAGLNGASHVAVHYHSSYSDALDLVDVLQAQGINAFPVQADVTNLSELWASRAYIVEHMGGLPPDLVICNSGLSESGYAFGRPLREVEGETPAARWARARQAFMNDLGDSRAVVSTKIDGFLAMTHLWSAEAVHAEQPLRLVYVSSRQAIDPGVSVPGYVLANWAVLQLPRVLKLNLGRAGANITAFSVLYPFVRTGMTDEYADNPRVFGRWQPRMLETHEAAEAFLQALARPAEETDGAALEVMVDPAPSGADGAVRVTWKAVDVTAREEITPWSNEAPLDYGAPTGE